MIDTHSHVDSLKNPDLAIKNAVKNGVEEIIVPSSEPSGFGSVADFCLKYKEIYGAVGVHPEEVLKFNDETPALIYKFAKENEKIIAIGEIGLDYYWDKTQKEEQKKIFRTQIEIALELDLPVLIHDREAHEDCYNILKETGIKKVIMHCFQGSLELAKKYADMGFLLGVGGVVTFKNSRKLKEIVKNIPLEFIVTETDAPYLTPHPFRGEENSPEYIPFIAHEIANLKDVSFEHVDKITTQNAKQFFNLK